MAIGTKEMLHRAYSVRTDAMIERFIKATTLEEAANAWYPYESQLPLSIGVIKEDFKQVGYTDLKKANLAIAYLLGKLDEVEEL